MLQLTAIVFLPLLGAILAGLFGRFIGNRGAQLVTCGLLTLSALLSLFAFVEVGLGGRTVTVELFTWLDSETLQVSWALRFDQLTVVMLIVVTMISALVHWYSIGYMAGDPGIPRFFAYLSLFTFFMLMLVTADNFLQLYFGWEGVGLCSYFLIGFWYDRPAANAAAIKAFIVNRVGDFGFALGIFAIFLAFNTLDFDAVFAAAPAMAGKTFHFLSWELDIVTTICVLLFIGAMGKSAQLGLHTWLPDAMEGPTPVSALIHAATMVTAGVYLVVRCSPLFEYAPIALVLVTVVGATTAIVTASIGLVQNDIKRVIAYSTCSQLGYMFFAAGVSAYSAAIFHLFTHGFFKALLFLGAGSVIHAMSDEQDMRKMGGIAKLLPITYVLMWVGSLALAGMPFFAGFFSKDMVLEAAYAAGSGVGEYAFYLGLVAAAFTGFYSWRLIFMTFHGRARAGEAVMVHVHEAPRSMTITNILLAVGAIFSGWLAVDLLVGEGRAEFWGSSILVLEANDVIEAAHQVPLWVKASPTVIGILGILLAWHMYVRRPALPGKLAAVHREAYLFLLNKWYFDELYDRALVRPAMALGRTLWRSGDGRVIDGLGPDGVAGQVLAMARRATALQSGYLYHYAFAMLFGVAALVTWYLVSVGG